MKTLPLRFRGKVVKVEYAYDDEVERWYVADHNIRDVGLALEADTQDELDANVATAIGMMQACDRELAAGCSLLVNRRRRPRLR